MPKFVEVIAYLKFEFDGSLCLVGSPGRTGVPGPDGERGRGWRAAAKCAHCQA